MTTARTKIVPTVAINRKGIRVIINETDFVKGKMKFWNEKKEAAKAEAAKEVKEAPEEVKKENIDATPKEEKEVTPKRNRVAKR